EEHLLLAAGHLGPLQVELDTVVCRGGEPRVEVAGDLFLEADQLLGDELLEATHLEVRAAAFDLRGVLGELPDRLVPNRPAGGEALAVDERLDAELDAPRTGAQGLRGGAALAG